VAHPAVTAAHFKFTHITSAISTQAKFNIITGEAVRIFTRVMDVANATWNVLLRVVDLALAGYQTSELLKLLAKQILLHARRTYRTTPLYMFTLLIFQVLAHRAIYTGQLLRDITDEIFAWLEVNYPDAVAKVREYVLQH
jgi:hypothetical protein